MIEVLITLCAKAMVGAVVADVKKELVEIPIKVAEQIFAGWNEEGSLNHDKVLKWVRFAEDAGDTKAAVEAALNSWKSKGGGDWTWDTLQLVSAVASTSNSLSNIMNMLQPVESPKVSDRVQISRPKVIVELEPEAQRPRKLVKKRLARGRKRVSRKTQTLPQIRMIRISRKKP